MSLNTGKSVRVSPPQRYTNGGSSRVRILPFRKNLIALLIKKRGFHGSCFRDPNQAPIKTETHPQDSPPIFFTTILYFQSTFNKKFNRQCITKQKKVYIGKDNNPYCFVSSLNKIV